MEGENLNVVAGEGIGADITNKAPENEPSSFKEKAKAKEKIENVSSKICKPFLKKSIKKTF